MNKWEKAFKCQCEKPLEVSERVKFITTGATYGYRVNCAYCHLLVGWFKAADYKRLFDER